MSDKETPLAVRVAGAVADACAVVVGVGFTAVVIAGAFTDAVVFVAAAAIAAAVVVSTIAAAREC